MATTLDSRRRRGRRGDVVGSRGDAAGVDASPQAKSPYLRREQLEPVAAEKGDVLDIRYATVSDMSGHDVLRYPDEKSWLACDESRAGR